MIVGLDVATRRLAAACPEAGFTFTTGKWGDKAQPKRDYPGEADVGYALGRQLMIALLNHPRMVQERASGRPIRFFYERPIVGRPHGNTRTAVGQALSAGAVTSQLFPFGSFTQIENSSTWKKELCGHGHSGKADVRAWLEAHHPALAEACGEDQDLVDAHCIALWAASLAS